MELVDICFNFTHKSFRKDEPEVIARAIRAGVTTMIVTGSSVAESARGLELVARYPEHLYATAGVHPHQARTWDPQSSAARLRELAEDPKVRAMGEMGLDYNRNYSNPVDQRRAFQEQLALAVELGLPAFLHQRDAHTDFLAMLSEFRTGLVGTVVHCFTGSASELEAYLELDCHIGITGWICDERRGTHLRGLVGCVPEDRLMIETDAPYLLPRDLEPRPRDRRNEPAFLPHVLRAVARYTGRPAEQVARQTTETARRFFRIGSAPGASRPDD
ncbi:MAG TPA: hydrolase TatD [Chromatiales bacterium]|nr:hydrolase TatD [Chromatiales bacterium]